MYGNMDKSVRYVCRGTLNKDFIAGYRKLKKKRRLDGGVRALISKSDYKALQVQYDKDVCCCKTFNIKNRWYKKKITKTRMKSARICFVS